MNLSNEFGDTPLIDVAKIGNNEIAELLLTHVADPNVTSECSDNALHIAVETGNAILVGMLLDKGAQYNYVTGFGEKITDALPMDKATRKAVINEFTKRNIKLKY